VIGDEDSQCPCLCQARFARRLDVPLKSKNHLKSMNKLKRPLIIVILGLLTVLLLVRLARIDISLETLRRLNLNYLLLATVIHYSGFLVRGLRWQALLAGLGHRLSYRYTTALLLAGWFVSALLPARLGDVARAAMLRRDHQISLAAGFASIATERAFDIVAILVLAVLAAGWALPGRVPVWVWQVIGGGAGLLMVAFFMLLLVPRLEGPLRRLFPWTLYQRAVGFGFELLGRIRQLGQRPILLLIVIAESLYIWLCDVGLMYFIFLSIGAQVVPGMVAFTSMMVDLAAAVPIIPGAVGQFEGAAIGVLSLFAMPVEQSSFMVLLNRFISFWTFIVVSGIITYWFGFAQLLNVETIRQAGQPTETQP
jgi:uncharacterized membrane protein YbhN (UPF0104 family)